MKKFILYSLLIIGVLILVFKDNNDITNEVERKSILVLEDTSNNTNELKIYLDDEEKYYTVKTVSDEAYVIESYDEKMFFYEDNGKVKLYDAKENKQYILDGIKSEGTGFIFDKNDDFIGVSFINGSNGHVSYLKADTKEILYDNKYDYIDFIGKHYLTATKYDKGGNQIGSYILDPDKEKVLLAKEMDTEDFYGFYNFGEKYISFEYANIIELYDADNLELLYKTNKANTFDKNGKSRYMIGVDSKDDIYIYEDNYLSILDSKGKVFKKSNQPIEGNDLLDKYVVNTSNKELTITDIDNNIVKIASLKNGGVDYYDYYNENGKEGLYFLVFDSSVTFNDAYNECKKDSCKDISIKELKDEEQYDYGYEYFLDYKTNKISKTPIFVQIGGKEKPILYLYPKEKTNVKVTFDNPNNLTTTYPKYNNSWEVTAYPNGDLYDKDGKYYYGLYWEEKLVNKVDFSTGFYVTRDNAIEFLESKLSIIGLNDKERNEFIMYWLPIFEKNSKSLVYFELTDEINKYNKINIYPKVDSLLRVTIHIKKVDGFVSIKEQVLPKFNRVGFSAVEWGGVTY